VKLAGLLGVLVAGLAATLAPAAANRIVPRLPGALAVGPNGNLYVADDGRNQILERRRDGTFAVVARGLNRPGGMVFGPNGTLYVAGEGDNRVLAISPHGTVSTVAGNGHAGWVESGRSALAAPLSQPEDVKLAANGNLVVAAASEVVRLTAEGRLIRIAGSRRFEGVFGIGGPAIQASADGPDGLAFDSAGDLFIAGFDTKALLMVTPAGTMRLVDDAFYPRGDGGLVTAPGGSVLAMDTASIVRVSPHGVHTVLDFVHRHVPGVRGFFLPDGIAVAANGDLYLDTDAGNGWTETSALIVIRPTGKIVTLWASSR
jgi:sugar lactone lactonase YvrE